MKKKKDPQAAEKLLRALDGVERSLSEEAYLVDDADKLKELKAREKMKKNGRRTPFFGARQRAVAVAAACMLLAVTIVFTPAFFSGDAGEETAPDTEMDQWMEASPGDIPWLNGELSLTSVTYKTESASLMQGGGMVNCDGTVKSENVEISLLSNTKISTSVNGNLLRVAVNIGEHADCDGVYYDIRRDEMLCMSCLIREQIADSAYYLDACIRCAIEECLITPAVMASGQSDAYYTDFYRALNTDSVKAIFREQKKPNLASLGVGELLANDRERAIVAERLSEYGYPIIKIVEYGTDQNRCLFTISSARGRGVWGAFMIDLDSGALTKLDGETVGLEQCTNGYLASSPEDMVTVDLSLATGICIEDGYSTVVATVPYFVDHLSYDGESGTFSPVYEASNVIVFHLEDGTYEALLGVSSRYDAMEVFPSAPAETLHGAVYYPTTDGRWLVALDGTKYFFSGELVRILAGEDGARYAVIKENDSLTVYALTAEGAAAVEPSLLETRLPEEALYVLDGNMRVYLPSGVGESLWTERPAAYALSRDGRFCYLYFDRADRIVCIDVATGESGALALSEAFVMQTAQAENNQYLLFLNAAEDRLLLAYYKNGTLTFDFEAFVREMRNHVYTDLGNMERTFNRNINQIFDYYFIDGESAVFRNKTHAVTMAKLLAVDAFWESLAATDSELGWSKGSSFFSIYENDRIPAEVYADIAERLIGYLDFSGNVAEVSVKTLNDALGGMSEDAFCEWFNQNLFMPLRAYNISVEMGAETPREELAARITSGVLWYIYGYRTVNEEELRIVEEAYPKYYYEATVRFYELLNQGVDAEAAEQKRQSLFEYILANLPAFREIDNYDGTETHLIGTGDELTQAVQAMLPRLIELATGESVTDFIGAGAFLSHNYADGYFYAKTNVTGGNIRCGSRRAMDEDALITLLSQLSFAEGSMHTSLEAAVYAEWDVGLVPYSYAYDAGVAVLWAGRDGDGAPFIMASGCYAAVTEEQYLAFARICSEGSNFARTKATEDLRESLIKQYRELYGEDS